MAARYRLQTALVKIVEEGIHGHLRIDSFSPAAQREAPAYPLVMVSSRFNKTFATTVHAASSEMSIPSGALPSSLFAIFSAAAAFCLKLASSLLYSATSRSVSFGCGARARQSRKARAARCFKSVAGAPATRRARACAASPKAGSFRVVSACNGVLLRERLSTQNSRLGASKVVIEGYGFVRRQKV